MELSRNSSVLGDNCRLGPGESEVWGLKSFPGSGPFLTCLLCGSNLGEVLKISTFAQEELKIAIGLQNCLDIFRSLFTTVWRVRVPGI